MSIPKPPPPLSPLSPRLAEIYQLFHALAETERQTALVDYLDDLCLEFAWVSAELAEHGFCASTYLLERSDGDDYRFLDDA